MLKVVLYIFLIFSSDTLLKIDGGRVRDGYGNLVGYVDNGTVRDAFWSTVGYYKKDGSIEDASHRTIYKVKDGRVYNRSNRQIGKIRGDYFESSEYCRGYLKGGTSVEKVAALVLLL